MDKEYLRQFVEMDPPLGCVPGGLIYIPNLEDQIRRQQRGLWHWEEWEQSVLFMEGEAR
jgi:hypothetical protein